MYNLMSHEGYEFHISLVGRSTRKGWLSSVRWWRLQKVTLCEGHRITCIKYDLHCIPLQVLDLNTVSVEKISKLSGQMKNDNVHSKVYLTDLGLVWGSLAFGVRCLVPWNCTAAPGAGMGDSKALFLLWLLFMAAVRVLGNYISYSTHQTVVWNDKL